MYPALKYIGASYYSVSPMYSFTCSHKSEMFDAFPYLSSKQLPNNRDLLHKRCEYQQVPHQGVPVAAVNIVVPDAVHKFDVQILRE